MLHPKNMSVEELRAEIHRLERDIALLKRELNRRTGERITLVGMYRQIARHAPSEHALVVFGD